MVEAMQAERPQDMRIEAEGCAFVEGPVALPDGAVAFVDLVDACVRVTKDGETRVLAELPGAPNGMRLGPDGALWIANNGGLGLLAKGAVHLADPQIPGCIMRLALDGTWAVVADKLPAPDRNRPNDLVFSPEGDVVFTNPRNWETVGRDDAAYAGGQLVLAKPEGGATTLLASPTFPNGLAFHPDGSLLVGLTTGHKVVRYAWKGGAALGEPELFCQLHDMFHSDGMVVEGERIYVAGSVCNEIAVLDLTGACLRLIDFGRGSGPTNLCVRGDRLWVTLGKAGQGVSIPLPE